MTSVQLQGLVGDWGEACRWTSRAKGTLEALLEPREWRGLTTEARERHSQPTVSL